MELDYIYCRITLRASLSKSNQKKSIPFLSIKPRVRKDYSLSSIQLDQTWDTILIRRSQFRILDQSLYKTYWSESYSYSIEISEIPNSLIPTDKSPTHLSTSSLISAILISSSALSTYPNHSNTLELITKSNMRHTWSLISINSYR